MTTPIDTEKLPGLIRKAIEYLAEMGAKFADDGSNEPLELSRALDDALFERDTARAQPASAVTDEMVQRFLGWRLPDTFAPDCYVSFDREGIKKMGNGSHWPSGTNLLNDPEARAMLEHVLAAPQPQAKPESARDAKLLDAIDAWTAAGRRVEFAKSLYSPGVEIGLHEPIQAFARGSAREAIQAAMQANPDE